MKHLFLLFLLFLFSTGFCYADPVQTGADQIKLYKPLLEKKRVGVFVNHTSYIGRNHLVDELLSQGISVTKIFVPEHGFRGDSEGAVDDTIDAKTGLSIVSLYGKKLKPTPEDLKDLDILVFDIQDVGVRFYTYISSLQKLMEAAVENNKPLIILDRPNPNGFYVDGPVLDPKFKSFTGMQPIAFIHGMTVGEYAKMLVGEEWLEVVPKSIAKNLKLTVIPCQNYTHKTLYELPIKPSPALLEMQSVYWYAAVGLFDATELSSGRGTDTPFQVFGHPAIASSFSFIPRSREGAKHPLFENQVCYGWDLRGTKEAVLQKINNKMQLKYILEAYRLFPDKEHFFDPYFNNAAGNDMLKEQIKAGVNEEMIRASWEPKLSEFKKIRKKYLLYPDFQ